MPDATTSDARSKDVSDKSNPTTRAEFGGKVPGDVVIHFSWCCASVSRSYAAPHPGINDRNVVFFFFFDVLSFGLEDSAVSQCDFNSEIKTGVGLPRSHGVMPSCHRESQALFRTDGDFDVSSFDSSSLDDIPATDRSTARFVWNMPLQLKLPLVEKPSSSCVRAKLIGDTFMCARGCSLFLFDKCAFYFDPIHCYSRLPKDQ